MSTKDMDDNSARAFLAPLQPAGGTRLTGLTTLSLAPYFDPETPGGEPAGGGAPAGGAPAASASPASGAASPAPAGQPGAAAAAGSGTPPARRFEYQEDRSTWVPPHRLRETTAQAERRIQEAERNLFLERQRVAALSGVTPPPAPEDPETAAIRQQFEKLYPGLAKLNAIADKLAQFGEIDPADLTSPQEHYFTSLGQMTLRSLDTRVKEVLGGGDLKPSARRFLHTSFGAYVQGDQENQARYAQQDPTLIDDFLKEYQDGILDPYRRTITAAATPRADAIRRLPRGGSGSVTPGAGQSRTLKPADTDEYHGAAFRSLQ